MSSYWYFVQEKVLNLKGSGQESSDLPRGFHFLGTMISFGHVQWRGPLKIRGNFDYIPGYWEWTKAVLSCCSAMETFKVLSQMGLGDFADLHIKLQDFFQKTREIVAASVVISPAGTSETL
ncbi:hypothetical protein LIER_22031 [Lithospermum erythrorhizon]|uniref:Uncharacterized protein n=1 Tax=Lithospermum erythrorhizon TaxID=34254 RepID=A0AAV3QSB1_LITER